MAFFLDLSPHWIKISVELDIASMESNLRTISQLNPKFSNEGRRIIEQQRASNKVSDANKRASTHKQLTLWCGRALKSAVLGSCRQINGGSDNDRRSDILFGYSWLDQDVRRIGEIGLDKLGHTELIFTRIKFIHLNPDVEILARTGTKAKHTRINETSNQNSLSVVRDINGARTTKRDPRA